MMDVGAMVADIIDAGCAPDVAAAVVARAFVAGANSTGFHRNSADSAADKRRAYDRERKRKSTGIPPESAEIPVSPILQDKDIKISKRQNSERVSRGTRIDPHWSPSAADRQAASDEGLHGPEIDREALRFRDYWAGRAGAGGVKLDWAATWRNWVRSTAEKLGRSPKSQAVAVDDKSFYAKQDSEELEAWDAYGMKTKGKSFPRDKDGGWRFPAQWPPGYVKPDRSFQVPPAILNRMQ
jgi:hypothetical protein